MPKVRRDETDSVEWNLHEGDTIEFGLQAEARVDGDKVWLQTKYSSTVKPGESSEEAYQRIEKSAQQLFTQHTMASVGTINALGN